MNSPELDLQGIIPYLVSPFDPESSTVRTRVLGRLVEHLMSRGVHGLTPLGSTGELTFFSESQQKTIVRTVVEAAGGEVPIIPGVAAFSTQQAISKARSFLELGADGIVLILQAYFPLEPEEVERFHRDVASSVSGPIVLYTNPSLTGVDVSPSTVIQLSEVENINYVKDASGNLGRVLTVLNEVEDRMAVFSASAQVPVFVLRLGGAGWMAGPASLFPDTCLTLYELCQQEQWTEAISLQKEIWTINQAFQDYSLAACVKKGLEIQGFDVGPPVPPQSPLDSDAVGTIRQVLESHRESWME